MNSKYAHPRNDWNEMEETRSPNPEEEKRLAELAKTFPVKRLRYRGPAHARPPRHPLLRKHR
jgi:hypothetical protein